MVDEAIPKVELHCHLIGVLDRRLLEGFAASGHQPLVAAEAVRPVAWHEGPDGFADWLVRVEPYKTAGWRTFLPILEAHIERLVAQRVVYAELMISPMMFARDLDRAADEFAEFRRATTRAEAGRIQIEFLFLVPRSLPEPLIASDIARCLRLGGDGGISGISIAGLERDRPVERFRSLFEAVKAAGLGIEIHAGELNGPNEVRDALDIGLADRIGHGIAAFEDALLVERLAREGVHIEFCPTSNLKMGAAPDIARHPIGRARDLGMNFSINTDDPGAFNCTMASEFELVAEAFGFTTRDFETIARNSLASRFCRELRGAAAEAAAYLARRDEPVFAAFAEREDFAVLLPSGGETGGGRA